MIHTILIAPYFGENMRHCLRCFADLPDCKLGVLSQEPADACRTNCVGDSPLPADR